MGCNNDELSLRNFYNTEEIFAKNCEIDDD